MTAWDTVFASRGWGRWPDTRFVEFVMRNWALHSPEERRRVEFIELGCGFGAQMRFLQAEHFAPRGYDSSVVAVKACRDAGLIAEAADIRDITVAQTGPVDCVVDVCTLQHLSPADALSVLEEARLMLRPGGSVFSKFSLVAHSRPDTPPVNIETVTAMETFFRQRDAHMQTEEITDYQSRRVRSHAVAIWAPGGAKAPRS